SSHPPAQAPAPTSPPPESAPSKIETLPHAQTRAPPSAASYFAPMSRYKCVPQRADSASENISPTRSSGSPPDHLANVFSPTPNPPAPPPSKYRSSIRAQPETSPRPADRATSTGPPSIHDRYPAHPSPPPPPAETPQSPPSWQNAAAIAHPPRAHASALDRSQSTPSADPSC